MKRIVSLVLTVLTLVIYCSLTVSAQTSAPTDSFSRFTVSGGSVKTVATRHVYESKAVISPRSLGITSEVGEITDIDCDAYGNTYILFDNSKVVSFDKDYNLLKEFIITGPDGDEVDFSGAKGILATDSANEFYIADTNNARVLYVKDEKVFREILLPDSEIIPSDFVFQPVKIALDSKNYLYVLSDGSYYGALLYDPNGGFVGFYGANNIKTSPLSALGYLWDRLTKNDIKRAKIVKTLPYQFTDICIDNRDFSYTCTGLTAKNNVGQIRILSPGGTNILRGASDINYGETEKVVRRKTTVEQNFCAIAVDDDGFIYALDQGLGILYVYDNKSNLIVAFGGGRSVGNQIGVFSNACAMSVGGTNVMIADSKKGTVTVFGRTEFGSKVFAAQYLTLKSSYAESEQLWREVLKEDSTYCLAYMGLAKATYTNGDYYSALDYAKTCGDNTTYSQALQKIINERITNNFVLIFFLAFLIIGLLIAFVIVSIKKKLVIVKNEKLRIALGCSIHPFRCFNEIAYKDKGSVLIASIFSVLFFVSSVICKIFSDFRYTSYNPADYNIIYQISETLCLIALFTISDWCVSTLFIGRGKIKHVYIVTAYSTVPMIVANFVITVVSHFIVSADSSLVSGIQDIAYVLTGVIIVIGLLVVHDFSFSKVMFTLALTVAFMILIVFVLLMLGVLFSQFYEFFASVFLELIRL